MVILNCVAPPMHINLLLLIYLSNLSRCIKLVLMIHGFARNDGGLPSKSITAFSASGSSERFYILLMYYVCEIQKSVLYSPINSFLIAYTSHLIVLLGILF